MDSNEQIAVDPLSLWLGKPAPRYTSYPPAPNFHAGVTREHYAQSLAALPADDSISLYIHIPFCKAMCLYCGCNTAVTQRSERVEKYLASVKREASVVAAIAGRRSVSHLHFGGGTPNIMTSGQIRELYAHLRAVFNFDDIAESAMELDPRHMTKDLVAALADCGVTRVSLGVQDFNAEVQEIVQRIQPYNMVAEVCGLLRDGGIRRINFDLMYGLPKQTPESVAATALQVCDLSPDRIALFSYAHVPQMKRHQLLLEAFGIPDAHQRLAMDLAAREVLFAHTYLPIGMDHFAKPDDAMAKAWTAKTLRRNFQGYTDDTALNLVGLGASSISQTRDGIFQNEHDERPYQECVDHDQLAVCRGYMQTPEDKLRGAVIEQLMCYLTCDIDAVCHAHGFEVEIFNAAFAALKPFEDAGLIVRKEHTLTLHSPHPMAVRVVCQAFDATATAKATHASRAA